MLNSEGSQRQKDEGVEGGNLAPHRDVANDGAIYIVETYVEKMA